MEQDDATLIGLTLGGDSAAFGCLVCRYQDRLFTALTHVSGSRTEAEDVAQDAFVQAYLKLRSFAGGSSFYTWLYRIAFNTAISKRRRKRAEGSVDQTKERYGDEPSSRTEAVDEPVLRAERAVLVRRALAELSEDHRAILILREMEGCDYEQISEILDLPVGTVRSRLSRARGQVKQLLNEHFDESECVDKQRPADS